MKTVLLTYRLESSAKTFEIVAFSMIEPSTMTIRFVTTKGEMLQGSGGIFEAKGDLDALPPFPCSGAAMSLRPAFGKVIQ